MEGSWLGAEIRLSDIPVFRRGGQLMR